MNTNALNEGQLSLLGIRVHPGSRVAKNNYTDSGGCPGITVPESD
jgi:hypothetical protein